MATRDVDRKEWKALLPQGGDIETRTTVRTAGVDVEDLDGFLQVSVLPSEDGVRVEIGDLELVVMRSTVRLMQKRLPYPLNRWTVLWEGDIADPEPV